MTHGWASKPTLLGGVRTASAQSRAPSSRWRSPSLLRLDDALRDCPDELWVEDLWEDRSMPGFSAFWYLGYHTLFWLDFYLSCSDRGFAPPAPFGLEELDPAGRLPSRAYERAELQAYLVHGRQKCLATITSATDEQLGRLCRVGQGELPFAELVLYTMRHVQEHAAQLNMFLGQRTGSAGGWVGSAKDS
jgi:DinB superfamily